jgi:hypothetical protein
VYDGTTAAILTGTAAITALGTDSVTLGGTGSGAFADKNVGTGKAIIMSGYTLTGTDADNYTVVAPTNLTANITPATLSYVAIPVSFLNGQTLSNLSGSVNGFMSGDTLASSTTGTARWTMSVTPSSPSGQYAITGGGLSAANYVFVQDAGNATALTLKPGTPPAPVVNVTAQMPSNPLAPQVGVAPQALNLSPTITVSQSSGSAMSSGESSESTSPGANSSSGSGNSNAVVINTVMSIGAMGPALQIVNGGIRMPGSQTNINQ